MRFPSLRTASRALAPALVASALVLAGCGDGGGAELSSERAGRLETTLDEIEQRVDEGDCDGAAAQTAALEQQVDALGDRVDRDLRRALSSSASRLRSLVESQCEPVVSEPTVTAPVEPEQQQGTTQEETAPGKQKKEKPGKGKGQEKKDEPSGTTGGEQQPGDQVAPGDSGGVAP
jgi:hypothetical protein